MKLCLILVVSLVAITLGFAGAITIASPPQSTTADEAALRQMQSQFATAWGKADDHALAALFAPDADLIIPTGLVMRGQAEIEAFYSSVFRAGYAGSIGAGEIARIRFLRPDLALIDATWSITKVRNEKGAPQPDESGVLALIASKTPAGWRIAALREQESARSFHEFSAVSKQ